jgi:hypothetical protein
MANTRFIEPVCQVSDSSQNIYGESGRWWLAASGSRPVYGRQHFRESEPMNVPSKLFRIIIGLVVACVVVGAIVVRLTDPLQFKAPSDEDLIAVFQAHRAEFERLQGAAAMPKFKDVHASSSVEPFGLSLPSLDNGELEA